MRFVRQALLGASLLALLSLTLTGCGKSVAKVNGEKISRQEYINRLEKMTLTANGQKQQVGALVLEGLIQEKLKAQLAKKEGVEPTKEEVKHRLDMMKSDRTLEQLKAQGLTTDEIEQQAYAAQVNFNLFTKNVKITDGDCKDFYDKFKGRLYTTPAGAVMGLIVTNTQKKTDLVRDLLFARHQEFASVAMKHADIEALRKSRGEVGFVPADINLIRKDLRPPLVLHKALFALKKGEICPPIKVKEAWFTMKMIDIQPEKVKSYPAVREQVRELVMQQKAMQSYQGKGAKAAVSPDIKMRKFAEDAKVKVNIRRYAGLWDAMRKQITTPPPAQAMPASAPAPARP